MRPKIWKLLIAFILIPSLAYSNSKKGTSTATFLRLEQGARAIGAGGAFTAMADDVSSLWWNPAGIARARLPQVQLSHTAFIEDITSQFVGFIYPFSSKTGSIGGSFTYFNIPGVEGRDAGGNKTGDLKANAYSGSICYGVFVASMVSVGVNAKLINQKLAGDTGSGFAVDLGLQFKKDKFGVGFSAQNLGPSLDMGPAKNPLPRVLRGGISFDLLPNFTVEGDFSKPRDGDSGIHIGSEWTISGRLAVRAGYKQMKDIGSSAGLSFGLSFSGLIGSEAGEWEGTWLEISPEAMEEDVRRGEGVLYSLDYAFVSYGDFKDTHRITLGIKF